MIGSKHTEIVLICFQLFSIKIIISILKTFFFSIQIVQPYSPSHDRSLCRQHQRRNGAQRHNRTAHHIDDGQVENGAVPAQPAVRHDSAQNREEVRQTGEAVECDGGVVIVVAQFARQIEHENGWGVWGWRNMV